MSTSDNIISSLNTEILHKENLLILWNKLLAKYVVFRDIITEAFGSEGVLILFCFALLILLLIIIYIKSVINTFQEWKEEKKIQLNKNNDALISNDISEDELEEERELSQSLIQEAQLSATNLHVSDDYEMLRKKMKQHAVQEAKRHKNLEKVLSKTQPIKDTNIISLTLNLLGRNVTEQKIAQALFFHFKDRYSENEIIQLIKTIRDFLGLCNSGKFMFLPTHHKLPSPEDAILNLAAGDASGCLILLQALLNETIEEASLQSGIMKNMSYALAANYACIMGKLAKFRDHDLAHNSFELATELSPKNVDAWDNLGDMFIIENSTEKSMIAYQNVLDIADTNMYASHIANAQKQMSTYYRKISLTQKANRYQQESDDFYDKYGITHALTAAESIAFRTIAANSDNNLPNAVHALLKEHSI